jgi:DNA primase
MIGGWQAAFPGSPGADYFLRRDISLAVAQDAGVGWDRDRHVITFPMYRNGELVAFKTRAPRDGAQMMNIGGRGRPWPLYPRVPREAGWSLIVAGELDALCGISAGLPCASVTLGAAAWREQWADELRGLYVLVCFDNDEAALTEKRVSELRDAGIRARHLDLRTLGLTTAKGDLSDFLRQGGDPAGIKPPGRRAT